MTALLDKQKRTLLARAMAFAIAMPFAFAATAQDTSSSDEADEAAATLDTVTVTGSRIKRAEIEGPAPVTVITRDDIDREGFQTVADVLSSLTQNTTRTFGGELATNSFTPNASLVNLRNLGPGYTLTLVNGRRLADYPQPYNRDFSGIVNVGSIPSSIIERVEILAGGASAIYGSDAVAGVVNLVLRKEHDGDMVRTTVGSTTEGGGDSVDFEFSGGKSGDDWSLTYALQYRYVEPVYAFQRDFLDDNRDGPAGQAATPSLTLLIANQGQGGGGRQLANPTAAQCAAFGFVEAVHSSRGPMCGSFNINATRSIQNKSEALSGYIFGERSFGDVEVWGSLMAYDSNSLSSNGTEFWGTAADPFLVGASGARSSLYYDPQFDTVVQLQRILTPQEIGSLEGAGAEYDEQSFEAAFGVRGTVFDDNYDWDFTVSHAKYEFERNRNKLFAKGIRDYYLGENLGFLANGTPIYQLNLDRWFTPLTNEQYRQFAGVIKDRSNTDATQASFTLSGDLFELPAGPVGGAAVLEFASQSLDLQTDARLNSLRPIDEETFFGIGGSGNIKGDRDRYATGVEFRIPVFSMLTATLAGRYDKYDDQTQVDDAVTYNGGLEFRPFEPLLLRANYGTSFRAPDLSLLYAEGSAGFSSTVDRYACRAGVGPGAAQGPRDLTACNVAGDPTNYQMRSAVSGNLNLEEEEGESFTYGLVWDIVDNLSFSADYYRIKLENAAAAQSLGTILDAEANCRLGTFPNGQPYPNDINSTFCRNIIALVQRQSAPGTSADQQIVNVALGAINQAITDTSGIDSAVNYRLETDGAGVFALNLAYTVVLTDRYAENPDDDIIDNRDNPLYNIQRSRVRGSLGWAYGDWTTTLYGQRYGSVGNFAGTRRLPPWMLYNVSVSKRFTENVIGTFVVNNVLDNNFREDATEAAYPFFEYASGADPIGRSFYLRAEYRF